MKRIQRKRTKGWKMPPNTVYVGRPTVWGNPFILVRENLRELIVESYWHLLHRPEKAAFRRKIRQELRGKNLACWCRLDQRCHADVLLEVANDGLPTSRSLLTDFGGNRRNPLAD